MLEPRHSNENNYVNRKQYHSINVQGICDHEGTCTEKFLIINSLYQQFKLNKTPAEAFTPPAEKKIGTALGVLS